MKLRQIIVVLFIFLSVAPLTLLGVTNLLYYNRKLENILENDLRVAVSTQVKAIDNFFEERQTDSAAIIGYQVVHDLLTVGNKDGTTLLALSSAVNDLLQSKMGHSRFVDSITVLNRNFVVAACSNSEAVGEISSLQNLDPVYFSPEMRFTHVITWGTSGNEKKVIVAVQQIFNGDELLGYVIQELNLTFFEEVRVSANLFNNGTIYLTDGKGNLIAAGDTQSSRDHYVLSSEERSDYLRAWEARDKTSTEGILRYKAWNERYLSCYSGLKYTDWLMISSVNMDQILCTKQGYRDLALLILFLLALLLVAVNFIVSRSIAKPIETMIQKFSLIKETQDYSVRMTQKGGNEIGTIAREINSLLSSVENYMALEKEKQARLEEQARRDPLTGLFNKATLEHLLAAELSQGKGGRLACLFVDVDDFKNFNTRYGHIGGDRVLCFIANALNEYAGGMAGRQGGDEFLLFLRDAPEREGLELSIRALLEELNRGLVLEEGGTAVPIRCSIGAALTKGGVSVKELVSLADQAMYVVKHHGKNSYEILADV